MVITTHARRSLPLDYIACNLVNSNYDKTRFAAVIMRCNAPRTTALFFTTGKIVCTGAKSVDQAHKALLAFVFKLRVIGIDCDPAPFQVENIVAASGFRSTNFRVCLDRIAKIETMAEYEPELFPGLTRRVLLPDGTTSTVVVFASGKMILTGNRRMVNVDQIFRFVQGWVLDYVEPQTKRLKRGR